MDIEALICCPRCHGELGDGSCLRCEHPFTRTNGQIRFVDIRVDTTDAMFQAEAHNSSSFRGRLFNAGRAIISSEFQPRDHLRHFLKTASGVVVELGSGSRRLRKDVVNIDLFSSPNVDIVADITHVPLKTACADNAILDSVIEHVPDPVSVVAEARRILKPGGKIFINVPFMLPYHGYPGHYQNFARDGLHHLLREFRDVDVRPTFGPMTAWVNMTAETFAVLTAGERGTGFVVAKGAALLPIFWLKYLDWFFVRMKRAHRLSGLLCATGVR